MPVHELIPEIAILLTAVAALLSASFTAHRHQWFCSVIALAGLGIAGTAAVAQLHGDAHFTFRGVWAVDGGSVCAKLIIIAASMITVLMVPEWLRGDRRHGEYYAVLCFGALGSVLMAGAADTMELVVGVLLSSVAGYTLAAYHRDWDLSVEAGMKFFLVGALANGILLIGVVWLFGLSGSTDYRVMADALQADASGAGWLAAAALVAAGLLFKLGAVPAHAWMPDVAQGAPAPSAAFLTVVPKVGAAVAMARLGGIFAPELPGWVPLIAAVAVASMTLGNLAALAQSDLRRLLGWSSVAQSGYALVAVALVGCGRQASSALIFFLAAYAAANLAAFGAVTELRGRTALADYRGLAWSRPATAAVLAVALLSLVGIPPLGGFVGKTLLMMEAVWAGHAWLAVAVVANTVLSLYYYLRLVGPAYFDSPPAGRGRRAVPVLGQAAFAAACLAGMLVVILGIGAEAMLHGLREAVLLPRP